MFTTADWMDCCNNTELKLNQSWQLNLQVNVCVYVYGKSLFSLSLFVFDLMICLNFSFLNYKAPSLVGGIYIEYDCYYVSSLWQLTKINLNLFFACCNSWYFIRQTPKNIFWKFERYWLVKAHIFMMMMTTMMVVVVAVVAMLLMMPSIPTYHPSPAPPRPLLSPWMTQIRCVFMLLSCCLWRAASSTSTTTTSSSSSNSPDRWWRRKRE